MPTLVEDLESIADGYYRDSDAFGRVLLVLRYKELPNLIMDDDGKPIGIAIRWNPGGFGECVVQYFDGSADSIPFSELQFPNGTNPARAYLDSKEL
jgi:hypothetical protein